jgi:hypothetical protein
LVIVIKHFVRVLWKAMGCPAALSALAARAGPAGAGVARGGAVAAMSLHLNESDEARFAFSRETDEWSDTAAF